MEYYKPSALWEDKGKQIQQLHKDFWKTSTWPLVLAGLWALNGRVDRNGHQYCKKISYIC